MKLCISVVFMWMLFLVSAIAHAETESSLAGIDQSLTPQANSANKSAKQGQSAVIDSPEPAGQAQESTSVISPSEENKIVPAPPFPSSKVSVSEASNWPLVLLTLLGMVVCILVIAWLVRRFSGMAGLGGNDLKVQTAIAIGTRERVAIVDVKGEQFLIGVTPQNISLLHHFDEAPIQSSSRGANKGDFAEKFQGILRQSLAGSASQSSVDKSAGTSIDTSSNNEK